MPLDNHSAAGPFAGALLQVERALAWLAASKRGMEVGIEILDDVAVRGGADGLVILEQDKSGVASAAPFADRSRNLWKTLGIWLTAVRDGEVALNSTRFYLVTNKLLGDCWVRKLQAGNRSMNGRLALARELRHIGRDAAESLEPFVLEVLAFSDREIAQLLCQTAVKDASTAAAGEELYEEIASQLHLPEGASGREIVQELLGWVVDETLRKIREGESAWLTRKAFSARVRMLIHRHHDERFQERAARLLTVDFTEATRNRKRNDLFARQLMLLKIGQDDEVLLEAIDDVLCCEVEFTRLADEGSVTESEVLAFKERLSRRWKDIFRRHKRLLRQRGDLADGVAAVAGLDILGETLEHREWLAGQQTVEHYLTRGSYHQLADRPEEDGLPTLGWHPNFRELLAESLVTTALAT